MFLKEYFGDAKTMDFFTFQYKNARAQNIRYYHLESAIDFDKNTKKWSGKQCGSKESLLPKGEGGGLLARVASICVNKIKLPYQDGYSDDDIYFDIVRVLDGNPIGNMTVIALDSNDSDSISMNDLGCKLNCELITNSASYIGKLNGSIRVTLHLEFNSDSVTGYYYYDKIRKKIKVTGKKDGNNLRLIADVNSGEELFSGVLSDGLFSGVWENSDRSKTYPFSFYLSLTQ